MSNTPQPPASHETQMSHLHNVDRIHKSTQDEMRRMFPDLPEGVSMINVSQLLSVRAAAFNSQI